MSSTPVAQSEASFASSIPIVGLPTQTCVAEIHRNFLLHTSPKAQLIALIQFSFRAKLQHGYNFSIMSKSKKNPSDICLYCFALKSDCTCDPNEDSDGDDDDDNPRKPVPVTCGPDLRGEVWYCFASRNAVRREFNCGDQKSISKAINLEKMFLGVYWWNSADGDVSSKSPEFLAQYFIDNGARPRKVTEKPCCSHFCSEGQVSEQGSNFCLLSNISVVRPQRRRLAHHQLQQQNM